MQTLKRFVSIALTSGLLPFLAGDVLHAEDIEGTIVRTLLLSEDTRLVGDVTCRVEGAACNRIRCTRHHAEPQRLHDDGTRQRHNGMQRRECNGRIWDQHE